MTWAWQQPYNAAILEKDPDKLPERLVTAEKAILHRLEELPDPVDELPEGRALREALDCLYALSPQQHPTLGQLADEDYDTTRRNWMQLGASVGLALFLLSTTGWIIAKKRAQDNLQRTQLHEAPVNSGVGRIVEFLDEPGLDARRRANDFQSQTGHTSPDPRIRESKKASAQKGSTGFSSDAAVAITDSAPAENPPAQGSVDEPPAIVNATPSLQPQDQPDEEAQEGASLATEPQEKSQLPEGAVSVTSSTYPSIRVPPELEGDTSSSGASLQIGEPISRVDPVYPEQAKREGVEGTVNLRAMIGTNGEVQNVEVMSGPALLSAASVSAVRQWRYQQTLLGDQPIEVAVDVAIVFRLKNPTTGVN